MRIHELNNEGIAGQETSSSKNTTVIQITESSRWRMLLAMLVAMFLVGILLTYTGMVVASNRGLKIPGITTIKEVIREVPKEVPVEKPVYIDRPVEKSVIVPVLPQQIWIDAPGNIPGCFPIFIHLSYSNGELRNYRFDICGREF